MARVIKTAVVRIDESLNRRLRGIAERNSLDITEASRELAKLLDKTKNRSITREIRF